MATYVRKLNKAISSSTWRTLGRDVAGYTMLSL